MSKISSMMDIGKRSMMNSQTALQTVSHNIANKSTEGFSRQRVDVVTATPVNEGRLQLGMGNRAAQVTRINNPYLEKQIQKEQGQLGMMDAKAEAMSRVEQVFNEQANKGLNQYMTDFYNAFRELANNPESIATRSMVKETADAMAGDFKRVQTQLTEVQKDIDEKVREQVEEVNKMIEEVASLNEKVTQTELQGNPANDQRDRRELLLKKLNERIDIHYVEGTNGMVTVSTAGNGILVSGYDHYKLDIAKNPDTDRVEVYYKNTEASAPYNITKRIKGGSLGGSLEVRDKVIENLKDKINDLAYNVATEVNNAHREGYDRTGQPGGDFFQLSTDYDSSAVDLKLNENIVDDVGRIAAAAKPDAIGDNTIANVISQLQYKEVMDDYTSTFDDYYNSQVGTLGVATQRAIKSKESQDNILNQLNTIRESISGVSLDEETTKMIEFQKAFDASARVIRTADEMFDTILNLKRL